MSGDQPYQSSTDVASAGGRHRVRRRTVLRGGVAAALGAAVVRRPVTSSAASGVRAGYSGLPAVISAMHVHASHSEGQASWEQQYANAAQAGVHVLWQTDHDFRARALGYMTLVNGLFTGSTVGTFVQRAASMSATGSARVLIESGGAAPAVQSLVMVERPTAVNFLRTGVQGQVMSHTFGACRLDSGARYELVVMLSLHPAQAGRPAGQYSLRYRFLRGATRARFTERGGLDGVVRAPMPANGTTVRLTPEADIRALWPDMLAIDNSTFLLSFVCTSPRRGVVADITVRSMTIDRPQHDAAEIGSAQELFAQTYSSRFGVVGIPSEEVSLRPESIAHCNVFGAPPEWALKSGLTEASWRAYYREWIRRVHGQGGVVSWNHPLGFGEGPELSQAEADQRRRSFFSTRLADDFLGADLLEVGYALRGFVPFAQHLAFWDTFSRRARWLTGNGVSDDHSGRSWRPLRNGFLTGIWSSSTAEGDLTAALRGGRAYAYHPNACPGLEIDTRVDGTVLMGKASVASLSSRVVEVRMTNLPADATVELVRGPVDLTGQDPATAVAATVPASSFGAGGTGTVAVAVGTGTSCFVRPQVRRGGVLVATGNPTWLLRQPPPAGIPTSRQPQPV